MEPRFDSHAPTVPAETPAAAPRPERGDRAVLAAACAAAGLGGLLIGILIGRAGEDSPAVVAAAEAASPSQLRVTSDPVEANVVVDGRFVGVSPVERIDLEPGKHTVVIDTFGYQPYAGTLEIEPAARASLKVLLVPLGESGATKGEYIGLGGRPGKVKAVTVPPTALAPISLSGTGTSREGPKAAGAPAPKRSSSRPSRSSSSSWSPPPEPRYEPPPRPRRDCGGEKSQCRNGCSSAEFSCRANCPNCVSCPSSVGWDECRRQCDTCRAGCDQNVKFCQSSCESQYSSCSASQ